MGMLNYIARRLLFSACLLLGVSVILFALINAIGNPIEILLAERPGVTEEIIQAVTKYYGLDGSVTDRYFTWLGNLARLDFGTSIIYNQPVGDMLWSFGIETLKIQVPGILLALASRCWSPSSPPRGSTAGLTSPSSPAPCSAIRCPASSSASC